MNEVKDKYLDLSNADLRIKLKTLENEYEALKVKIIKEVERLAELDNEYVLVKQVLNKRTRGLG